MGGGRGFLTIFLGREAERVYRLFNNVRTSKFMVPRRTWRGPYQAPAGEHKLVGEDKILGASPTERDPPDPPLLLSNELFSIYNDARC